MDELIQEKEGRKRGRFTMRCTGITSKGWKSDGHVPEAFVDGVHGLGGPLLLPTG